MSPTKASHRSCVPRLEDIPVVHLTLYICPKCEEAFIEDYTKGTRKLPDDKIGSRLSLPLTDLFPGKEYKVCAWCFGVHGVPWE